MLVSFYTPTWSISNPDFPTLSLILGLINLFNVSSFYVCISVVLICISLITNKIEYLFIKFMDYFYILFG